MLLNHVGGSQELGTGGQVTFRPLDEVLCGNDSVLRDDNNLPAFAGLSETTLLKLMHAV
jgi:hypothetical protein